MFLHVQMWPAPHSYERAQNLSLDFPAMFWFEQTTILVILLQPVSCFWAKFKKKWREIQNRGFLDLMKNQWPRTTHQNNHCIFMNQAITSKGHQMSCFWAKFKKNEEKIKIVAFKLFNAESKTQNDTCNGPRGSSYTFRCIPKIDMQYLVHW